MFDFICKEVVNRKVARGFAVIVNTSELPTIAGKPAINFVVKATVVKNTPLFIN